MHMDAKEKIAQLIVARLDGREIDRNLPYYESLAKQGIGGFIIFGGDVQGINHAVKRLQKIAPLPLLVGSDLEQGLGQQVEGGTVFPPAMAVARAIDRKSKKDVTLLRNAISVIAREAEAAGMNTIFSPVADINTNPQNPIICTRSFGDDPKNVAWFAEEYIRGLQREGIIACVKHFPGHGDTAQDSHRELPVVKADRERLDTIELYPFRQAVQAGVHAVMVGHLKVPVLDSRYPATLSRKIIQGTLRQEMNFQGLVITDAMNMHAVAGQGRRSRENACLNALKAGADIILHPDNPEGVIEYLLSLKDDIMPEIDRSFSNIVRLKNKFRKTSGSSPGVRSIGLRSSREIARELTEKSVTILPPRPPILMSIQSGLEELAVLITDDDDTSSGEIFSKKVREYYPAATILYLNNKSRKKSEAVRNAVSNKTLIAAVFSRVSAWKGRSGLSTGLYAALLSAVRASRRSLVIGFCCPYVLRELKADVIVEAFSGDTTAQEVVGRMLFSPCCNG
jgi:beta-glucosidase-like glycosyl hydrolase